MQLLFSSYFYFMHSGSCSVVSFEIFSSERLRTADPMDHKKIMVSFIRGDPLCTYTVCEWFSTSKQSHFVVLLARFTLCSALLPPASKQELGWRAILPTHCFRGIWKRMLIISEGQVLPLKGNACTSAHLLGLLLKLKCCAQCAPAMKKANSRKGLRTKTLSML